MKNRITLLMAFCLTAWQPLVNAQKFVNPLPIPYLMNGPSFNINIQGATHNFDPNGFIDSVDLNEAIPTYCYNENGNSGMNYLGPTLIFDKSKFQTFNIANSLPNSVNTTVHWHGLNVPAQMDGGPHQVITNGATWSPSFSIIDPVQTIWYHSHLMDQTTDQVIRGLAGMIIVQDPQNDPLYDKMPRDYGINDLPIIIQEKGFEFETLPGGGKKATGVIAGDKPGNGIYTLVNGVVGAVMHVPPEFVRLRVLNGSPRKMFHIGISSTLVNPTSFADMYQIASGGGYLDQVHFTKTNLMAIGDRREFVVDFGSYANGDTVYLSNLNQSLPADANYGSTPGNAIMAFVVDNSINPPNPSTIIPINLDNNYGLAPGPVFKTRSKKLMGHPNPPGNGQVWTIDGIPMNMGVINDTVLVNTKEEWVIENTTEQAHPFHIHKVQFQVTKYEGTLGFPDGNGGITDQTGVWEWPNLPDELVGYKDVQLIRKNSKLTFQARFDSFSSPLIMPNLNTQGFMYHCHILTHEDSSMMHQFVVVDSLSTVVTPGNTCADANDINPLFGGPQNVPQTSGLYNNTSYTSVGDPTVDCWVENTVNNSIWFRFTGTGDKFHIETVPCNATNYIGTLQNDTGDTQMLVFSGNDCNSLTQVACNDDLYPNGMPDWRSAVDLMTQLGQDYFMLIDGHNFNGTIAKGEFCVEVTNITATAVTEISSTDIRVFPNPTTGAIQLANVTADQVQVFDHMGRLVLSMKTPGNSFSIENAPAGMYFLKITEGERVYSARVVKE